MRNSSYSILFIQHFKRIRFDVFFHKSTKYTIYSNGLQIDSMLPHQTKHYIFMVEYVFMCLILNSSFYLTTGNIYLKATTMRIIKRFTLRFAQYAALNTKLDTSITSNLVTYLIRFWKREANAKMLFVAPCCKILV